MIQTQLEQPLVANCLLADPYQPKKYTAQLHYICVGHRVEAPHPGVEHGYQGRPDDRRVQIHLQNNSEGGAYKSGVSVSAVVSLEDQ